MPTQRTCREGAYQLPRIAPSLSRLLVPTFTTAIFSACGYSCPMNLRDLQNAVASLPPPKKQWKQPRHHPRNQLSSGRLVSGRGWGFPRWKRALPVQGGLSWRADDPSFEGTMDTVLSQDVGEWLPLCHFCWLAGKSATRCGCGVSKFGCFGVSEDRLLFSGTADRSTGESRNRPLWQLLRDIGDGRLLPQACGLKVPPGPSRPPPRLSSPHMAWRD